MRAVHVNPIEAVETPFARARAHVEKVEGMLASDEMIRKTHSELEEMLDGQGKESARLLLEENLRLRAQLEQQTEVVGADDVKRRSVQDSERHLETLLGRVAVPRLAYHAPELRTCTRWMPHSTCQGSCSRTVFVVWLHGRPQRYRSTRSSTRCRS